MSSSLSCSFARRGRALCAPSWGPPDRREQKRADDRERKCGERPHLVVESIEQLSEAEADDARREILRAVDEARRGGDGAFAAEVHRLCAGDEDVRALNEERRREEHGRAPPRVANE